MNHFAQSKTNYLEESCKPFRVIEDRPHIGADCHRGQGGFGHGAREVSLHVQLGDHPLRGGVVVDNLVVVVPDIEYNSNTREFCDQLVFLPHEH